MASQLMQKLSGAGRWLRQTLAPPLRRAWQWLAWPVKAALRFVFVQKPLTPTRRWLDRSLSLPMAVLAYAFVVLMAWVPPGYAGLSLPEIVTDVAVGGMIALYPLFAAEALLRLLWIEHGRRSWKRVGKVLATLIPPLRIGLNPVTAPRCVCLPWLGWRRQNKNLRMEMERLFSVPMIFIAVLILPVLALEFVWNEPVQEHQWLAHTVAIATQFIWLAFAIEFFTGLAVDREKLTYVREHWIDALIVLMPLVSFLRALRLLRLGQVLKAGRLSRMSRIYRLRGLAQRGFRALLLLRVIERWSLWGCNARIRALQRKVEKKHEEITEIEQEIAELKQIVRETEREKREAEAAAEEAGPAVAPTTEAEGDERTGASSL